MKIPKRIEAIKRHIEEFEKALKSEKRRFGCYDDSGGIRYIIGSYYMLAGDIEGALKHFKWFKKTFSDDMGEPGQSLSWTLALYKSGDSKNAYIKFLQTLFMNPYVIARIIGIEYNLSFEPGSNIPTKEWADLIPDEIYNLWDGEAKGWLKESFNREKTRELLARYNELGKLIETEPVGAKRSRLVTEFFAIVRIEEV